MEYVDNTNSSAMRDMVICIVWGRNTAKVVNGICLMMDGTALVVA